MAAVTAVGQAWVGVCSAGVVSGRHGCETRCALISAVSGDRRSRRASAGWVRRRWRRRTAGPGVRAPGRSPRCGPGACRPSGPRGRGGQRRGGQGEGDDAGAAGCEVMAAPWCGERCRVHRRGTTIERHGCSPPTTRQQRPRPPGAAVGVVSGDAVRHPRSAGSARRRSTAGVRWRQVACGIGGARPAPEPAGERRRPAFALWGEDVPQSAVKTIQVYVARLRKALGDEPDRIVTTPAGYRLRVGDSELDAERFERRLADGRRAGRRRWRPGGVSTITRRCRATALREARPTPAAVENRP